MDQPEKRPIWKSYFALKEIGPVVRFLTLSDILIISGFGLIMPIFAVYITDNIKGGSLEVVGIAAAIYSLTKGVMQIPLASLIDRKKGERDDFWSLCIGSLIYSLVPLLYIFVNSPWQLYLVQFLYGLAAAFALPAWLAIFTRHVDKHREGTEWAVYQTLTDFGVAAAASLGGFMAYRFGFTSLFLLVSAVTFMGVIFLTGIYKSMRPGKVLS